ncbi:MAG: tetratricopeptide repeat protein, partial [Candidatus Paceibacterales bacterium]
LCKESTGVLPFVIIAYLAVDKTKWWPQKLKYLWPFFIGLAGYLLLRQYFGITNVHQTDQPRVLILGFVTFLRSVITDLRLFVLPVDLHYDRCLPFMLSMRQPQALATCFFWAASLIIFVLCYRKIRPLFVFLIFWFFLELLPVSQLVTSIGVGAGHVSTAEHFLYLACIPVFIGMVMAFRAGYELSAKTGFVKASFLKFFAGGFLVFLFLTAVEQSIYASSEFSMLNRSLAYEPNNPRLQGAMAMLSVFRNDIPDAEKHFRLAIKAEPLNPTYHIGLGTALCQQGKWIEGLEQYVVFDPGKDKDLVERQAKLTMAHIRQELSQGKIFDARGWLAIGIYYAKINREAQAIEAFLQSANLNPAQADAWFNLGSLYEALKNWPAARMAYKKLLDLHDVTLFQRDFASKHLAGIGNH